MNAARAQAAPRKIFGSLFARTVLVILGGLVVAQVLSAALLFDERSRWFLQGRIGRSSHRIADAALVLDAQKPAIRSEVATGFATKGFNLSVLDAPPSLPASDAGLVDSAAALAQELSDEFAGPERARVSVRFDPDAIAATSSRGYDPFQTRVPGTLVEAALPSSDGQHWYQVSLKLPADARGLPEQVLWDMAVRLVLLLLLLLIAVRWITRPLSVLATAADRLGRNLDEPPIPERGPSEVLRAAQAFNRMQQRLRDLLAQKARMLAAVSHDLKTPITRLRLRAEMLPDEQLRTKIGRDLDEMEAMVGATLELMRGAGTVEPLVRTDLLALIESLQADYEDMDREVGVSAGSVAPIELRPQALRRCLTNLIDNGLNYGQRVHIAVIDAPDRVRVEIDDEGPGIPEPDLERVFEPFYRLEGSRNRESGGTGLGLSIARAIAAEHAGTITLANRSGGGLRACLTLPRR